MAERPPAVNTDLWDFLRSVSQAGEYDSSGHFTVDVHQRRTKLRLNQFADPTHAILCCVRAGVTSGAESMEIRQIPQTTTITLSKTKELRPKELVEGMLGDSEGAETEKLLGAAFQGMFANGCRLIEVKIPGASISLTPDDMKVDSTEDEDPACRIFFHFPKHRSDNRERCARDAAAVFARAAFCPIPLSFDGVPVNESKGWQRLFPWQRTEVRYGVSPDFVWLEAMLSDVGERFPMGVGSQRFRVEYVGGERTMTADWEPTRDGGFLRIMPKLREGRRFVHSITRVGSSLEGPSYIFPLKQGVVLEPIEEDLGAAAVGVIVRADELDVDLSLFQVIKDHRYEKLANGLHYQTKALVHRLGQDRKAFVLPKDTYLGRGLVSTLSWGIGGALFMAPAGVWGILFGGLAASCAAGVVHSFRFGDRALTSREQQVWWELDRYVESVQIRSTGRLRL